MINTTQIEKLLNEDKWEQTIDLENDLKNFPYCMLLHYIDCKCNKNRDLSHLALLVPSRKRLYDLFVKKESTSQTNVIQQDKKNERVELVEKKSIAIEDTQKPIENNVVNPQKTMDKPEDENSPMAILQKRLAELEQSKVADSEKETSVIGQTQIVAEEIPSDEAVPLSTTSVDELIEKFNTMPSKRAYLSEDLEDDFEHKDLAKSSLMERTNIVSETLAELYVSQNLYDKALKIYEALMVKYPEKNAIFANRIKELKVLKDKNK